MKNKLENKYFTIVIPTRERCDTLKYSLKTCVEQKYDNLEIIVSDNLSNDSTEEIVKSYNDKRIKYIKTTKRLSMTENYEYAMSYVKPRGYVVYLGDDDGLLPNAINDINLLICQTNALVLQWDKSYYWWPNNQSKKANTVLVKSLKNDIKTIKSKKAIKDVLFFKKPYTDLPVLYISSVVSYDVIKKVKNKSGKFYHSMTPDVYSGFAIAGCIDSYLHTNRSFTISGSSHHSTGASQLGDSITEPGLKFLKENNLPFHSDLVYCNSLNLLVIEAYMQARDNNVFNEKYNINFIKLFDLMMNDASRKSNKTYVEISDVVLKIAQKHNLFEKAEKIIKTNPNRLSDYNKTITPSNIFKGFKVLCEIIVNDFYKKSFSVDCSSLNVSNIYEASLICSFIYKLYEMNCLSGSTYITSSINSFKRALKSI